MQAWLLLMLIIAVAVIALLYTKQSDEGFLSFKDATMLFTDSQYKYFHNQAGKGIITNPGIQLQGINDALKSPDLYLPKLPESDYRKFFIEDPSTEFSQRDNEFCRGANVPNNLPNRGVREQVGCGWYFVPESSVPSVGALGTRDGPLLKQGLPPNGTWIWDRNEAIKKEEIKKCKRVRNCELVDMPGIKGVCGFCQRLGHGVPIHSNGTEKYPDDAEACGLPPVVSAKTCQAPPPLVTEDGVSCGTLGRPSADNTIRLYSKAECDKLGGNHVANGECLKRGGGSYSWDCRQLNNPPEVALVKRTCDPDARGYLSRECLISIAESIGYNKNGGILKMLYSATGPTELDTATLQTVRQSGVIIPEAVLGRGDINVQSANSVYKQIFDRMTNGSTNLIKNSAKHLVAGVAEFDVCDIASNERGPFSMYCLQRAFRESGCQPAGSSYPVEQQASRFANMSWGEINGIFKNLRNRVNSSVAAEQDKAVKDCLGIDTYRPPAVPCKNPGMEYLYYSFNGNDILSRGWNNDYCAFMGVEYATSGFKRIDVATGFVGNTTRTDQIGLKLRSMINPSKPINERLDIWTDDGVRVLINNSSILDRWWDMAPTYWATTANLPGGKPSQLEIHWYEHGGLALLDARGAMDKMNNACFLPFPRAAPVIAFDFFRDRLDDIHGTVQSSPVNMRIVSKAGRRGAQFGPGAYIQMLNPYRFKAIRSITFMVHWDSYSGGRGYIFNACRNPQGNSQTNIQITGGAGFGNNIEYAYFSQAPNGYRLTRAGAPIGAWTHYAIVYTGDHKGATLYINGNPVGTERGDRLYGGDFPDDVLRHVYLGRPVDMPGVAFDSNNALNATLGWFHMYDRSLTLSDIKEEMGYWDNVDYKNVPIPSFQNSRIHGRWQM